MSHLAYEDILDEGLRSRHPRARTSARAGLGTRSQSLRSSARMADRLRFAGAGSAFQSASFGLSDQVARSSRAGLGSEGSSFSRPSSLPMFLTSSVAPKLDEDYEEEPEVFAPRFEVLRGAGLDAEARSGVSPRFVQLAKLTVILVSALFVLSCIRVALTTMTVTSLISANTLQTEAAHAQNQLSGLKVQRSVLSNIGRISSIATENYGMVLGQKSEALAVSTQRERDLAALSEQAQTAIKASVASLDQIKQVK